MNKISLVVAKNRNLPYLAACLLLSLVLLSLPGKVKSGLSGVIIRFTYAPFYALSHQLEQLKGVYQENKRLREMVMDLTLQNSELKEEHLENSRLRSLLEFGTRLRWGIISAEVVAAELNRPAGAGLVVINKGRGDRVKRNMPVVNLSGLVGKIEEVFPSHSTVQLMLNPNFRVSALDQRSRVFGIVRPCPGQGSVLKLDNIPSEEDVRIGDEVVSAGLGGIFPAGIRIGVVCRVGQKAFRQMGPHYGIFKEIDVKPSVDFNSLEEIFLLNIGDGKER